MQILIGLVLKNSLLDYLQGVQSVFEQCVLCGPGDEFLLCALLFIIISSKDLRYALISVSAGDFRLDLVVSISDNA